MVREPFRRIGCRESVSRAAVVLTLAVVALVAPVGATGDGASPAKMTGTALAIESSRAQDFLVRVDANSLRRVSKRLPLGGHAYAWSLSPNGRRLAIGFTQRHGVRIIDIRRMKPIARIPTWSGGIGTLAWVSPRRILGWEQAGLFLLDPVGRKRLPSRENPARVLIAQRAGNRLVLLGEAPGEAGTAELSVVGGDGVVRTARLDRIRATGSAGDDIEEFRRPALVLASAGRAYVVGTLSNEPVAEVELDSLTVTYHELRRERSLLSRFWQWLEPAAQAKEPIPGGFRAGMWLGDGNLAVWGDDSVRSSDGQVETTPAGLSVIDTNDWTLRVIDADASYAAFAGGTLLATYRGGGLSGFTPSGERKYHLFEGDRLGVVATFGERAFVAFDRKPVHVLEAATGGVLGTRRSVPRLLHPSFSGW
jgi:hypothetical protein